MPKLPVVSGNRIVTPLPFRSLGAVLPPAEPERSGGSFTPNWVGGGASPQIQCQSDSPHSNPSAKREGLKAILAEIIFQAQLMQDEFLGAVW